MMTRSTSYISGSRRGSIIEFYDDSISYKVPVYVYRMIKGVDPTISRKYWNKDQVERCIEGGYLMFIGLEDKIKKLRKACD